MTLVFKIAPVIKGQINWKIDKDVTVSKLILMCAEVINSMKFFSNINFHDAILLSI